MAGEGKVSTTLSEWLLVALILFSLVIEALLHRLEHWIKHKHNHLASVVRVVYRELMVLGLVTIVFITYESINRPSGTIVLSFEFAHVFIFLFAIFYAFIVLCSMFTSLRLSSRWKKMERMDVVDYLNAKNQYTTYQNQIESSPGILGRMLWWFPNIGKLFRYRKLHEIIAFHDIRFQFVYYRNLPEHFRFSSFLRKIKSITFIHLVESHWSHYVIFLCILLADLTRRYIKHGPALMDTSRAPGDSSGKDDYGKNVSEFNTLESIFIIIAAALLVLFGQILSIKIRRIYWELTKNPRLYYEGVDPEAFEEELEKVTQSSEQSRSNLPSSVPTSALDTGDEADDEHGVARGSSARPEDELLDPMFIPPIRSSNSIATANDASNLPVRESHTERQIVSSATTHSLGAGSSSSKHQSAERYHNPGLPFDPSTERAETDVQPVVLKEHRLSGFGHPLEEEQSGTHHSTDTPTGDSGHKKSAHDKTLEASFALAAVEAAKKRVTTGVSIGGESVSLHHSGLDVDDENHVHGASSPRRMVGLLSSRSSRRVSTDDEHRSRRTSFESRSYRSSRRVSIEMAVVMPRDELATRLDLDNQSADSGEEDMHSSRSLKTRRGIRSTRSHRSRVHSQAQSRARSRAHSRGPRQRSEVGGEENAGAGREVRLNVGVVETEVQAAATVNGSQEPAVTVVEKVHKQVVNPSLMANLENQRLAQNTTPNAYPRWVIKLIPRLGRVASPVEKLFWFGSHQFFLWCVEFVLFFSTVITSAAFASLSLLLLTFRKIEVVNTISIVLSAVTLLFTLLKTAEIMQRYIFILHNASLIPEVVALEAIHIVRKKRVTRYQGHSSSESETEHDGEAHERRRRLNNFFRREAERGNVPGIEGGSGHFEGDHFRRKWRRRNALRQRRVDTEFHEGDFTDYESDGSLMKKPAPAGALRGKRMGREDSTNSLGSLSTSITETATSSLSTFRM